MSSVDRLRRLDLDRRSQGPRREEARRRGWGDTVLFVDEEVSGSEDVKRPARDTLEARLAAGELRALIVKSVDRLARSTADLARIVKVVSGW